MIEFIHTAKSFGKQEVHKDISLTIPTGKITFIIGPSGTGKSVFLKQIMGLIKPDKGQILLDNQDITKLNDKELLALRAKFGYVFQNAALFDYMNVFDNVAFPLREHTKLKEAEIKEKVETKLLQVGLKDVNTKFPSELSGGMRKRVGLARAIVLNPEIMLYDEPTTGLDPIMTDVVDNLIADTQRSGENLTSVVISHDIRTTLNIADKIAMIYGGYIVAEGSPEEFKNSDDPIIRQFLTGSRIGPITVD